MHSGANSGSARWALSSLPVPLFKVPPPRRPDGQELASIVQRRAASQGPLMKSEILKRVRVNADRGVLHIDPQPQAHHTSSQLPLHAAGVLTFPHPPSTSPPASLLFPEAPQSIFTQPFDRSVLPLDCGTHAGNASPLKGGSSPVTQNSTGSSCLISSS